MVDLGKVEDLKNYVLNSDLHYITFFEVLIITEGAGYYSLDDDRATIKRGTVIITLPNQVRRWSIEKPVKGFSFFFEGEFLNNYFRDDVFLNRFAMFDYNRPYIFCSVENELLDNLKWVLNEVEKEFLFLKGDSSHLFRSLLYYTISLIDRQYRDQHGIEKLDSNPIIYQFKKLIDTRFKQWHTVLQYAGELRISHNHLNALCKKHLSKTALQIIQDRIMLEAKRELVFSQNTVGEIAYALGFSDVSNFNRKFKSQEGCTPKTYRLKHRA